MCAVKSLPGCAASMARRRWDFASRYLPLVRITCRPRAVQKGVEPVGVETRLSELDGFMRANCRKCRKFKADRDGQSAADGCEAWRRASAAAVLGEEIPADARVVFVGQAFLTEKAYLLRLPVTCVGKVSRAGRPPGRCAGAGDGGQVCGGGQ